MVGREVAVTDKLSEVVASEAEEIASRAKAEWLSHYDFVAALCESPIERILLAALWGEALRQGVPGSSDSNEIYVWPDRAAAPEMRKWSTRAVREPYLIGFHLRCQVEIGNYRVDFLIHWFEPAYNIDLRVVIECDGHDYHERTKQQAARDKSRDRALQAAGFRVLRFTGSEIYRAPRTCAEQVITMVMKDVWRARGLDLD